MRVSQPRPSGVVEFGDFQTPDRLACAVTQMIAGLGFEPRTIIEPTCGEGSFVRASTTCFPMAENIIGVEINETHLDTARASLSGNRVSFYAGNFFTYDWEGLLQQNPGSLLVIGNPPWVTNAQLGSHGSKNVPEKFNLNGHNGIDAITGKSNFDISEWMIRRYIDWTNGRPSLIAALCKTTVARKTLSFLWKQQIKVNLARIYRIDSAQHFNAAVDACLLVLDFRGNSSSTVCSVYASLAASAPLHEMGFVDGHIVNDVAAYMRFRSLAGRDYHYTWRSGVKHDCSKVMELALAADGLRNGFGQRVKIEDHVLFPMLKSSDVGNSRLENRLMMVVPQTSTGFDTNRLVVEAPLAWKYLIENSHLLDNRGSSIYKGKTRFAIFGVGQYTFAPWKVAISGFYKRLHYMKVGPMRGKSVVFDDTVYFLPCWCNEEADFVFDLMNSEPANEFFNSMVNWDEKRPITADLLRRLNLSELATMLDRKTEYESFASASHGPLFRAVDYGVVETGIAGLTH